jgi:hypothetical protein
MKTYLLVTAILFGLLAVVHLLRAIQESHQLAHDPWFVVITVVAAAMSFWAFRLWRKAPSST